MQQAQAQVAQAQQQAASALSNTVGGGQLFAQGQQIIATPGPNGQMTYSVLPSFQTVNIDGQDAIIMPSSSVAGAQQGQAQVAANASNNTNVQNSQQTLLATPTGQILRAQGVPAQSTNTNLFQNVAGFGGLGNIVNIGGNLVSLGNVQNAVRPSNANNNIMQAVQIPGIQAMQQMPTLVQVPVSYNGQTVFQTVQLPSQNIPIQSSLQQGTGVMALGSNAQNLQTLMASQSQVQSAQATSQSDDTQQNQNQKSDGKSSMGQLVNSSNTNTIVSASTPQKSSGISIGNSSPAGQSLSVINTPQGQVILSSPPSNQPQSSQSLPTLTVPSYPQTISTNASSASSTTTSTATQNTPVLQNLAQQQQQAQQLLLQSMAKENVLAQQQILQGMAASGQNIGGIQLANQGQMNQWLQQALTSMQTPRAPGVQALQVQNLQGLQNLQAFPALQSL